MIIHITWRAERGLARADAPEQRAPLSGMYGISRRIGRKTRARVGAFERIPPAVTGGRALWLGVDDSVVGADS